MTIGCAIGVTSFGRMSQGRPFSWSQSGVLHRSWTVILLKLVPLKTPSVVIRSSSPDLGVVPT